MLLIAASAMGATPARVLAQGRGCTVLRGPALLRARRREQARREVVTEVLDSAQDAGIDSVGGFVSVEPDTSGRVSQAPTDVVFGLRGTPSWFYPTVRDIITRHLRGAPAAGREGVVDFDAPPVPLAGDSVVECPPANTNPHEVERALGLIGKHVRSQSGFKTTRSDALLALLVDYRGKVVRVVVREGTGDEATDRYLVPLGLYFEFRPSTLAGVGIDTWVNQRVTIFY
jgi:hypothetical protein